MVIFTEGVQPAERAAVERREAQAVDQRHIRFRRSGDNAFLQTAHHFVDHRDHHAGDNLFFAEIALRLAHFCQQVAEATLPLQSSGGAGERWWFLNGEPLTERGRNVTLHLTDKGDYQLLVMDDVGQIATVKFVMQ